MCSVCFIAFSISTDGSSLFQNYLSHRPLSLTYSSFSPMWCVFQKILFVPSSQYFQNLHLLTAAQLLLLNMSLIISPHFSGFSSNPKRGKISHSNNLYNHPALPRAFLWFPTPHRHDFTCNMLSPIQAGGFSWEEHSYPESSRCSFLYLKSLLLDSCMSHWRSFLLRLFWPHKVAVFPLPISLFFYILFLSFYHDLTHV